MPRAHSLKISPLACHLTLTISLCSFLLRDLLSSDFFLIFIAKKIHDVGVYLPNFFKKCLLALPRIPKKNLGSLGPPPLWGPEPPHAPFGGSGAP